MSVTINSAPTVDAITLKQKFDYNLSVPANTTTKNNQLHYQLFSITDGAFVTYPEAVSIEGTTWDGGFIEDAKKNLESTFPVGLSANGHKDLTASKSFTPFWACLETDIETCDTQKVNEISSPEIRVVNSLHDLDLSVVQPLTLRPQIMVVCRGSHNSMLVWFPTGDFVPLKINGTLLGNIPISTDSLGSAHIIDFTRFVGVTTESVEYTVGGVEYKVIIKDCCDNVQVISKTTCGGWENLDFNLSRKFSVDIVGTQAMQNKIKFFTKREGNGKYALSTCLDYSFENVEFVNSWLTNKDAKMNINGTWIDVNIEDGSFDIYEDEKDGILTILVSKQDTNYAL